MKTKQQEQPIKKIESTKNYDEVSKKIRKLLKATAEKFVPELCQALKDDWYPSLSNQAIQSNKDLRDKIRDRILDDWSKERNFVHSTDNIWKDITIEVNFPDWLLNPSEELKRAARKNLEKANQAKSQKSHAISERRKQKIDEIVKEIPDEILDDEDEEPKTRISDEEMHDLGIAPYTEKGKSIRQLTGDIVGNALRLFAALVNNDTYPNSRSDILVDYIRPSREFRRGLMLELDRDKRTEIHNYLYFVITAAEDTIEIIRKINEKEDK